MSIEKTTLLLWTKAQDEVKIYQWRTTKLKHYPLKHGESPHT